MKINRLIGGGFAAIALMSAAVPTFAYTVWPDVDFEWYANTGKPLVTPVETAPAPRAGYIWAPARYEVVEGHETWVAAHWVKDELAEQKEPS